MVPDHHRVPNWAFSEVGLKGSLLWNLVFQCFPGALDRNTI